MAASASSRMIYSIVAAVVYSLNTLINVQCFPDLMKEHSEMSTFRNQLRLKCEPSFAERAN